MSRKFGAISAGLIAGLVAFPPCAHSDSKTDILEIRSQMNEALKARNFEAISAFVTESVVMVGPAWTSSSSDQLKAHYTGLTRRRPDLSWIRIPESVQTNDPWSTAFETGQWKESWTENGDTVKLSGTYSAIWKRVQGQWKMSGEIFVPLECQGGAYCKPKRP